MALEHIPGLREYLEEQYISQYPQAVEFQEARHHAHELNHNFGIGGSASVHLGAEALWQSWTNIATADNEVVLVSRRLIIKVGLIREVGPLVTNTEVLLSEGLSMLHPKPATPGAGEKRCNMLAITERRGIYRLLPAEEAAVQHPANLRRSTNPSSAYLLTHSFDGGICWVSSWADFANEGHLLIR